MANNKSPSSTSNGESLDGLTTAHFSPSAQSLSINTHVSAPNNVPRPIPGSFIDDYEVLEALGEGGMGVVYKVQFEGRFYALKLLLTPSKDFILRFRREAEIIGQLQHPHIVQLHTFQSEANWPYIVFDFVEGSTLHDFIRSRGPLSLSEAIDILDPIAKALNTIHSEGIFHRDIKPANILIRSEDSAAILTDFGLAKVTQLDSLTKTGEVLGTLYYMAPEQFTGQKCQVQTDTWALGLLLYEMVSGGKRPFRSPTPAAYAHSVLFNDPQSLSDHSLGLPPAIDLVIGKALQKEPERRYQSASEFIADCQRVLNNEKTKAQKPSLYQRFKQNWIRRFGRTSLAFFAVILVSSTLFGLNELSSFIQQKQRHSQFEADTIPQLLSIIERMKVQRRGLDSDIVRHLSSQKRELPCCQSASQLGQDISDLRTKIRTFKAQQAPSESWDARLSKVQQLQESMRLSTLIHQVKSPLTKKQFPTKHFQFYQALSLMLQQDYKGASNLLDDQSTHPKKLASAFQFAKALCLYQSGQFREAAFYFGELKSQGYHEAIVTQRLVDSLVQKSISEFYEAPVLKEKFSATLKRALSFSKFNQGKLIKRWDKLVQERFQSTENAFSNKNREQVYLAYRSFAHQYPKLTGLKLTKDHWEQCLRSARHRKNQAPLFFYCYQLQRIDPKFPFPKIFEFALDKNGQFNLLKLRDQLSVMFFLRRKTALEIFQFTYEASFHGIYLDLFEHGDIRRGIKRIGIIEERLTQEPANPLLQLWTSLNITHSLLLLNPKTYYSKAIKPLEYSHNHQKLLKPYRALALTTKVERLNLWAKGKEDKMTQELQQQCFKDLEKAIGFYHPCPETIYWHRKDLRLWRLKTRKQIRDVLPLVLEDLKQYRLLIQARYRRAKYHGLLEGRPAGLPYTWISGAFFEEKIAYDHQFRGLLYQFLGQLKVAEQDLVTSCEVLTEHQTWRVAVKVLQQTKNRELIQRLQIQINNLLQGKLEPADVNFFKVKYKELSLIKNLK